MRIALPLFLLLALACGGTDGTLPTEAPADQDVRGVYALTYSDELTIRLDIGGAVQETTASEDDVVTFNAPDGSPLELDLAAWCADPNVLCPSEAWPANVAIDQDDPTVAQDLHTLHAWDADAPGDVVDGLVDHRDDHLLFGLDGESGGTGDCGALSLSLAGGRFAYPEAADTGDTALGDTALGDTALGDTEEDTGTIDGVGIPGGPIGIVEGQVAMGWLGVCAWEGLVVAATLSIETDYTATRVGDLD